MLLEPAPSRPRVEPVSTSLLTDHYELTMVDAALRSGAGQRWAVFECFARRLPPGRRYGVLAGTARVLDALERFRFEEADLAHLEAAGFLSPATLAWLADYRFSGTIVGYREGELFFPGSPVLTVESTFAEAVVLETLVLSILNHDSAVASGGARMITAAAGRPLVEVGSRRTHELAAPAAARAAYLVGFASTSNLEAGRRWGVPTGGTTAHAFVLAHGSEREAFAAQVAVTGPATTLLVDTFDVEEGIRSALAVAGPQLAAIRIDSGDLAEESRRARRLLDELGATGTAVVVSGDLDEDGIARLVASSPVDRMLVGTELVTGSGAPTAGLVYKLVAVADDGSADAGLRAVAKRSVGKATTGGVKHAARRVRDGRAAEEVLGANGPAADSTTGELRPLQVPWVRRGAPMAAPTLEEVRRHHVSAKAELCADHLDLRPGPPALPTVHLW